MEKCKIYVVAHKKYERIDDPLYQTIQVGNAEQIFGDCLRDNTGDHISNKNKNYCELTAIYWLWKNVSDLDYIGICHYRRYFTRNKWSTNKKNFLNANDIIETLKDYDVILPRKMNILGNVRSFYYMHGEGREKDIDELSELIYSKYSEYKESFDEVLHSKSAHYYNMFIISKKDFDSYSEWLFSILFEIENRIDLKDYTPAEARIYGYMSEILLNVWIKKHKKKVKCFSIINIELNIFKRIINEIKNGVRGIKGNL